MVGDPERAEVAVLSFHKIGEPPADGWRTWNYIPEQTFVGHLEWLVDRGYEVLDWQRFLAGMEDASGLPERSVLLTFDDGYRSMGTVVCPLLERFDFPAVVFVPTMHVGRVNAWDAGNEPEEPICTWDELRDLAAHRVSVQSHGVTHTAFSALDESARSRELAESKRCLEAELDRGVDGFAFPYGDPGTRFDATQQAMRDAGYAAAFLYKGGVATLPTQDPFRVPRVAMGPDTDLSRWLG